MACRGLAIVTDAMEAAGMAEGEYELSGRRVRLENGSRPSIRRDSCRQRTDHRSGCAQLRKVPGHPSGGQSADDF